MTELTDMELKEFLKSNMTRIKALIDDEVVCAGEIADGLREDLSPGAGRLKESIEEKKEKAEDAFKDVYKAFMNPDAHRHFVKMGLEFFMGLGAIMDGMPVPDSVRRFQEDVRESRKGVRQEFCRSNEDCAARRKDSDDPVTRIEID